MEIASRQNARMAQLQAAISLGRLYKHQGKQNEARKVLTPILACRTPRSQTTELKEARALLSEL